MLNELIEKSKRNYQSLSSKFKTRVPIVSQLYIFNSGFKIFLVQEENRTEIYLILYDNDIKIIQKNLEIDVMMN